MSGSVHVQIYTAKNKSLRLSLKIRVHVLCESVILEAGDAEAGDACKVHQ